MKKFKDIHDIPGFPANPTKKDYEEYYEAGALKKEDLEERTYYWGGCRNSPIAMWYGGKFHYLREKFKDVFAEEINHFADDDGSDVFVPLKKAMVYQ